MDDTTGSRDAIIYRATGIDDETLDQEIRSFWEDLRTNPVWQDETRRAGVDPKELAQIPENERITVSTREAGFDPATTAIIIAFSPVAAGIVRDVWQKVILPRIATKYQPGTLKEKEEEA